MHYNKIITGVYTMSTLHHESLLEQCYDEAWIDYRNAHNLTDDQLYALEQNSEHGYLPVIADDARSRFDDLCR